MTHVADTVLSGAEVCEVSLMETISPKALLHRSKGALRTCCWKFYIKIDLTALPRKFYYVNIFAAVNFVLLVMYVSISDNEKSGFSTWDEHMDLPQQLEKNTKAKQNWLSK